MRTINGDSIVRVDFQQSLKFTSFENLCAALNALANVSQEKIIMLRDKLTTKGRFQGSGADLVPFHNAKLCAVMQTDQSVILDIWTDESGNKPEILMSQQTGAQIGYSYCEIKRNYPVDGERFAVPLADIKAVYDALGQPFNPTLFLNSIVKTRHSKGPKPYFYHELETVYLRTKDGFCCAILASEQCEISRDDYELNPEMDFEYKNEGDVFTGPFSVSHNGKVDKPLELYFRLIPVQPPTYDTSLEQKIRACGDVIETALRGNMKSRGHRIEAAQVA